MHRRPQVEEEKPALTRAMVVVLGTWSIGLLIVALFVIPLVFAPCIPNIPQP